MNPYRPDLISTFGETSGVKALVKIKQQMQQDHDGSRILAERPIVRSEFIDLDALRKLPDNTFGKLYSQFLDYYGYNPDARNPVSFIDDPDLAYIILRYREIHDFVHVLLAQPTTILGEVNVKWVEAFQTKLPLTLLAGFFGPLRLTKNQTRKYLETDLRYAIKVGRSAKLLINVYFEKYFERDIDDFRHSLAIPPPPSLPQFYSHKNAIY
ncbi:Ubiquinone biosynthesis protein [Cichlidogyrus casuarinus]|uniref:Ubiquinone biosynthesis protein COQ4 homolog, mitochondrial n=1 Tax=Cichlidogyrus casuarinus TaxID=1844966 RepID=A0ABD2QGN8_9PLAT